MFISWNDYLSINISLLSILHTRVIPIATLFLHVFWSIWFLILVHDSFSVFVKILNAFELHKKSYKDQTIGSEQYEIWSQSLV